MSSFKCHQITKVSVEDKSQPHLIINSFCPTPGGKILARFEAPIHSFLFPEEDQTRDRDLREIQLNRSRKYQVCCSSPLANVWPLIQPPICVSICNVSIVGYCPSTSSVHPYSHLLPQPPCSRPLSSLQLTPSSTKQPLVMMVCIRAVLRIYHSPLLAQVVMESKRQLSDGCSAPPLNCKQGRYLLTPKPLSHSRDTTLPPSVVREELQLKPNCTPFSTATLNLHPSILPRRDRMDLP